MFRGKRPQGFTIVETMIFLAISGILFLSAIEIIDGQQNKTQFFQAIHVVFSQLQTVSNDVSDGYYNTYNDFTCSVNPAGGQPAINYQAIGTKGQGGNLGCTYIGEFIQLNPDTKTGQLNVYTMVGRQFQGGTGNVPVNNLTEAAPIVFAPNNQLANVEKQIFFPEGLTVGSVYYTDPSQGGGTTNQYTSLFGFMSSFAQVQGNSTLLQSGSQDIDIVPLSTSGNNLNSGYLGVQSTGANSTVEQYLNSIQEDTTKSPIQISNATLNSLTGESTYTVLNPQGGMNICFKSSSTNQIGIVTIGANNDPSGMQLKIENTTTCP